MSFFGLTQLGYQEPIRESVKDVGITPQHVFHSGLYREPPYKKLFSRYSDTTCLTTAGKESSKKDECSSQCAADPCSDGHGSPAERDGHTKASSEATDRLDGCLIERRTAGGEIKNYNVERAVYSRGYAGDDVSYHNLQGRIKFQKYKHEPTEVYRKAPQTSCDIGLWMRDKPISETGPWTQGPRFPLINSELTRFVNEMGKTNKEFSLY